MGNKRKQTLRVIHPKCAGIDVGKTTHYVAVEESRDERPVQSFASFTDQLQAMAAWLRSCEKASSQLPGAGLALMRRRTTYSMAESFREGVTLVHEAEDVAGSGGRGHGRLQSGIGEMRSARASIAPIRLSDATRFPQPFARASSRGRGVHPGGLAGPPARVPPRGSSPCSTAGRPAGRPDSGEPR